MDYTSASGYVTDEKNRRQYTDRNDALGVQGSFLVAKDRNAVQNELINIIEVAGLVPSADDETQVLAAGRIIFAAAERGVAPYSAALAKLIDGYPKYSIVVDATGVFWVSQSDKNTTVPGADGAQWKLLFDGYATQEYTDNLFVKSEPIAGQKRIQSLVKDASGRAVFSDPDSDTALPLFSDMPHSMTTSSSGLNTTSTTASLAFTPARDGFLRIDATLGAGISAGPSISVSGSGFSNARGGYNHGGTPLSVGMFYVTFSAGVPVILNITGNNPSAAPALNLWVFATVTYNA